MTVGLDVRDLCVSYGAIAALRDVSLNVAQGETVAILGANGAGKTTLLRALSGLHKQRSGTIMFDGERIGGERAARVARRGISLVPEGREVFTRLTVEENLRLGAMSGPRTPLRKRIDAMYELFPKLAARPDQLAGTMSGGEQQMVAIARGLISEPRLLMLDEPSMGLSPLVVGAIFEALHAIRKRTSLLVVEQNSRAALGLADRAYVLDSGRVVAEGTPAQLGTSVLEAAYLGASKLEQLG